MLKVDFLIISMKDTNIAPLIRNAAAGDADALERLCYQYRPVLLNLRQLYWLRLYDDDDWEQEARWVCFLAAKDYDAYYHLSFGRFYKMRLKHHIITLLRQQLAVKRRCDQYAMRYHNLDNIAVNHQSLQITETVAMATLKADTAVYCAQLSQLERQVFYCNLHCHSNAEIAQKLACSEEQVCRAISRCRLKMHLYMELG